MWKLFFVVFAAVLAVGLGGLIGGPRDIDINDAGAREAINFAVVEHNRRRNDMWMSQVSEVVKVQSQVVAGTKYIITVKMGKTPCRHNSASENCVVHSDPQLARPYQCTFTVWSRPWINDIRLLDEKC